MADSLKAEDGHSEDILLWESPQTQVTQITRHIGDVSRKYLIQHLVNITSLLALWGTGMIASSSTVCSHLGKVIRDLFRQLHAVWYGTGALVYSNHAREAAASSYLSIIFGRIASGFSAQLVLMQLSHQCWRWCRLW